MKYKFRINFLNQILTLRHLIVVNTLLAIIYLLFFANERPQILKWLILFTLLSGILPAIAVHLQYLIKNFSTVFVVDISAQKCFYTDKFSSYEFTISDIDYLEHHASYGGGANWYSFGEYRYFNIFLKDQKSFIITSLMDPNIKSNLEKSLAIQAEKKLTLIAFL